MTNQELMQAWVEALRSGKYQQNPDGNLRTGDTFSACGVLLDLIDNTRWIIPDERRGDDYYYVADTPEQDDYEWFWEYPCGLPFEDFIENNEIMMYDYRFELLADAIERLWNAQIELLRNTQQEKSNE